MTITELIREVGGFPGLSIRKVLAVYHILLSSDEIDREEDHIERAMTYLNLDLDHVSEGTRGWSKNIVRRVEAVRAPAPAPFDAQGDDDLPF